MADAPLVLVADDDPSSVDMMASNLRVEGYDVLVARNGVRAVELAIERVPDVVLLDVAMPQLSGIEVCERLDSNPRTRNVPVLMVTGSSSTADKVLAFTAGADDYIIKPFDPVELLARVRSTLRRAHRMRDANPLTRLPGNVQITEELAGRVARAEPFALLYIDLDNFKSFNDFYGFLRGDRAIKLLASCTKEAVDENDPIGFIGHIGGDDLVAVVEGSRAEPIARSIIVKWDSRVADLYDMADLSAGHIVVQNRLRQTVRIPLMTVSIGIASNVHRPIYSHLDASELASELKAFAKTQPGSTYSIDRRQLTILLDEPSDQAQS